MVFEKLKDMITSGKERKSLEQFTPQQKQRIFERISSKEDELVRQAEDRFVSDRLLRLEDKLGLSQPPGLSGRKKFREMRLANMERQKERTKKFKDNERLFREGKLGVKPVGPSPKKLQSKLNTKLKVKPLRLKAPDGI